MATVLITGGRAPVALDMVRLFSKAGHRVLVADSIAWPLAGASRHVAKTFKVPAPRFEPEAFAKAIRSIARQEHVDLVIPTCEEVFYLGSYKSKIEAVCPVFCPDMSVLATLHNKWEFARAVERHSGFCSTIQSPQSWVLSDASELNYLPLPTDQLVLKPIFSRFAVSTLVRPAAADLDRIYISPANRWVAQSCVTGQEFCTYAICRDGEIIAHAAYKSSWRAGKGASYYFDPIEAPDALAFAQGLARHFNLTGQVAFDFIRDEHGQCWVLECNPRATSGLHLIAGNPRVAETILTHSAVPLDAKPVLGFPRMLGLAMAIMGLPAAIRNRSLEQWLQDFRRGRDVLWCWTDPAPFPVAILNSARFAITALFKGGQATAETTRDIEWNGAAITSEHAMEAR